jgi:hypothetical protein
MMSQAMNSPEFGIETNFGQSGAAPATFETLARLYTTQTRLMDELKVLRRRRVRAVRQRDAYGAVVVVVDAVIAQIDARRSDVLDRLRSNRALAAWSC